MNWESVIECTGMNEVVKMNFISCAKNHDKTPIFKTGLEVIIDKTFIKASFHS